MGTGLLIHPLAWANLCGEIDRALRDCPAPARRDVVASAVQAGLREALGTRDIDVTHYLDPVDLVTHFDVQVRGVAAALMRDPDVLTSVRQLLMQVRDRYAAWLDDVPLEERAEEAAALSDDDLARRARALRRKDVA